jgi:hypothetical protein
VPTLLLLPDLKHGDRAGVWLLLWLTLKLFFSIAYHLLQMVALNLEVQALALVFFLPKLMLSQLLLQLEYLPAQLLGVLSLLFMLDLQLLV